MLEIKDYVSPEEAFFLPDPSIEALDAVIRQYKRWGTIATTCIDVTDRMLNADSSS